MKPIALLALTALAACSPSVRSIPIPAELATCADEATAPTLPAYRWEEIKATAKSIDEALEMARVDAITRDKIVFEYILAQRAAHGDCKADVNGIKAYREAVE